MPLLTLKDTSLAYGNLSLLEKVNFNISSGERICLVGRNGTGKSTLFRVISGSVHPDEGDIWRQDTLKISYLEQEVPPDTSQTIYEVVSAGLGDIGEILIEYHNLAHTIDYSNDASIKKLAALQQQIEVLDGWNLNQKIETVLSRLSLPEDKKIADCSGGIRRRTMLAQALVSEPDLLLLDEPTNHMDIKAINWLEEFLLTYQGALIFITHDRTFLKHLATRIVELDRGNFVSFNGNFDYYLNKKEEFLKEETRENAKFDKKLAQEEVWIRQGIKARRTRNEGRVRALESLRMERSRRQEIKGTVNLDIDTGEHSGKRVADLSHVSFSYDDEILIDDLSTTILRGDRIGIIGPNGSGKSTLLKLILGELQPNSGNIVMGTRLDCVYFDQQRQQLDMEKTVRENVSGGNDMISVRGRSRHVISYLKDFLFPPEQINSPVKTLSGGERNRLLLANLFTSPANMMVLDEPTNDLDVDTLELLEELLAEYEGTLLLVSHDRSFLDNVVTSTLVFEENGKVGEYVGGYEDWIRQRKSKATKTHSDTPSNKQTRITKPEKKKKLGFNEKRELDSLPEKIESMEQQQEELEQRISKNNFYQLDKETISETMDKIKQLQLDLKTAYKRWEFLAEFEA
ncbi:MAG: ATP-binding cassette subfamily F protein uup [Gammaproteobacteria bacterium]|jgi:ATP-binding cassette subfamily F protein uup